MTKPEENLWRSGVSVFNMNLSLHIVTNTNQSAPFLYGFSIYMNTSCGCRGFDPH